MRFGATVTPDHRPDDDPTLPLERDLQVVEQLDELGFDEAWFGEHHGSGWQYISCPETFMAAASQRTTRIRLATGVAGLPFQHPLMLADRIVLLDHLSRGRVVLGTGPGGPQVDAPMMGFDLESLKVRHADALEAIVSLLTCDEPIDRSTDWFSINRGRLQLRHYRDFGLQGTSSDLATGAARSARRMHALRRGIQICSDLLAVLDDAFVRGLAAPAESRPAHPGHLRVFGGACAKLDGLLPILRRHRQWIFGDRIGGKALRHQRKRDDNAKCQGTSGGAHWNDACGDT